MVTSGVHTTDLFQVRSGQVSTPLIWLRPVVTSGVCTTRSGVYTTDLGQIGCAHYWSEAKTTDLTTDLGLDQWCTHLIWPDLKQISGVHTWSEWQDHWSDHWSEGNTTDVTTDLLSGRVWHLWSKVYVLTLIKWQIFKKFKLRRIPWYYMDFPLTQAKFKI